MTPEKYNRLNTLLAEYSVINAALEAAEAEIKTVQLAAAERLLPQHAQLKVKLADLETSLRTLSDQHYIELFEANEKRTHATPFGSVKYTRSRPIEVGDEEKTILKIKVACTQEEARHAEGHAPRFTQEQLIRTREELNLEALGELDDVTLSVFGLTRVIKDNFKVVPFQMATDKPGKAKPRKSAS